jgi:hypothetical protein
MTRKEMQTFRGAFDARVKTELADAVGHAQGRGPNWETLRDHHMSKALGMIEAWAAMESVFLFGCDGECDCAANDQGLPVGGLDCARVAYRKACLDVGYAC